MTSPAISSIRTTIVNIPFVAPFRWTVGSNAGYTHALVEVEAEDGTVGLGEASNWRHAFLIGEEIAPRLIGKPAIDLRECRKFAIPPIEAMFNTEGPDLLRAYGAIEMALWDLRARLAQVPLYALLGGAVRKRIAFTEYFSGRDRLGEVGGESSPEEIAAYCERMVNEHGSPFFEGKVGYTDLETDVATARAVRSAIGPERMLRLDANMGWKLSTAREALSCLADQGIANVEDPVGSLEEMAQLRQHSTIPFSTHGTDLREAARLGVPDAFVLNLTVLGGIEPTLRFVAACAAMGVGFGFYSGETGVGTAAYLHVGAAEPHLSTPSQSLLRWYATDVIVGGPFQPEEGYLKVPEGPGLGVELDSERLAAAHTDFLERGPLSQSGSAPSGFDQLPLY